jgi:hypothetical protein
MKAILLQLVAITLCVVNYAPAMAKDPPGVNPQHFQCYSAQEKEPGKHEVTLSSVPTLNAF